MAHGGRVLAAAVELVEDQGAATWTPLQAVARVAEVEAAGPGLVQIATNVVGKGVGKQVGALEQGEVVAVLEAQGVDPLLDPGREVGGLFGLALTFRAR